MGNKQFFWLRLHRDFFKRHDIRIVEAMPNGKDYILFYLKLLVESIDHDGNLRFSDTIPYSPEMLGVITATNVDVVRSAIDVFKELNMIEIEDDGTIFMREVDGMIGKAEADEHTRESTRKRVARYRERQKALPDHSEEDANRYSSVTVTDVTRYSSVTCNGEIEKEIEIEKDIDIYSPAIAEIVDYLNQVCGTKYKAKTSKTASCIRARLKEGYKVEDFKLVIDKKHRGWAGTEWEKYLRPETLFGTKFESYLNEKESKAKATNSFNQFTQRDYDFEALERELLAN